MRQAVETALAAGTPRPLFPFEAGDVAAIYTHKRNACDGLWFALIDGRVFDHAGEPDSTNPEDYESLENDRAAAD